MSNVISAKIVSNGRYIVACCPFCVQSGKSIDTKYHLYILKDAWVYCYRCGYKSSYKWLISNYTLNLCNSNPSIVSTSVKTTNFDTYVACHTQIFNNSIYSNSALTYLFCRNISEELINYMNIKLGKNEMFGRVIFIDESNKYFMGRAFLPFINPKTMNPIGNFRPLMYFDEKRTDALYLVEGVFDLIPFVKTNRNACALLGKDIALGQLQQLMKSKITTIIVCLDSDARQAVDTLVSKIISHLPTVNIGFLDYKKLNYKFKDPSDYDVKLFDSVNLIWIRKLSDDIKL